MLCSFFSYLHIHYLGRCVAMDPITRVLGALSLWSIEIVMQMRIYALYDRSKKVTYFY